MPERYEVAFEREYDPLRVVGRVQLRRRGVARAYCHCPTGDWHAWELWAERYYGVVSAKLELAEVPAHGARVLALRPARATPCVVGTSAHIGCGAARHNSRSRTTERRRSLRIGVGRAGRSMRRVYIATARTRAAQGELRGRRRRLACAPVEGRFQSRSTVEREGDDRGVVRMSRAVDFVRGLR